MLVKNLQEVVSNCFINTGTTFEDPCVVYPGSLEDCQKTLFLK